MHDNTDSRILIDGYGRRIDYLRISLTDKCNLRCAYCMPAEGVGLMSHSDILSLEETVRLAGIMTEMGIRRIRLTGGELLVRKGVVSLVEKLGALPAQPELAMTTNGVFLAEKLEELTACGMRSFNISLDTLDRECFHKLTGTDALTKVLDSIDKALEAGCEVKLNCVPLKGINDRELPALLAYAGEREIPLRFIELMPIGCGSRLEGMSREEVLEALGADLIRHPEQSAEDRIPRLASLARNDNRECHPERSAEDRIPRLASLARNDNRECHPERSERSERSRGIFPSGPSRYLRFNGADIGFISPLSHSFCGSCNRIRLTADGQLKLCLCYPDGPDLKKLLREGAADCVIEEEIRKAILKKPGRHCFTTAGKAAEDRRMFEIGG